MESSPLLTNSVSSLEAVVVALCVCPCSGNYIPWNSSLNIIMQFSLLMAFPLSFKLAWQFRPKYHQLYCNHSTYTYMDETWTLVWQTVTMWNACAYSLVGWSVTAANCTDSISTFIAKERNKKSWNHKLFSLKCEVGLWIWKYEWIVASG